MSSELHADEINWAPLRTILDQPRGLPHAMRAEDLYAMDIVELEQLVRDLQREKEILREMLGLALDAVNLLQQPKK